METESNDDLRIGHHVAEKTHRDEVDYVSPCLCERRSLAIFYLPAYPYQIPSEFFPSSHRTCYRRQLLELKYTSPLSAMQEDVLSSSLPTFFFQTPWKLEEKFQHTQNITRPCRQVAHALPEEMLY